MEFNQVRCASADRLAALFLFEQIGDDIGISAQADLVALDFRDEPLGNVMVMVLVSRRRCPRGSA